MRKSTAALMAVGSAFALTAAAASAIAVTGPFDPAAGTGPARTCDTGAITVDAITDGTWLTGFTVKTTNDTTHTVTGNEACQDADIWVRVDYTEDPAGTPVQKVAYASFSADGNFSVTAKTLNLGNAGASVTSDFEDATSGTPSAVDRWTVQGNQIDGTTVLVTTSTPTGF